MCVFTRLSTFIFHVHTFWLRFSRSVNVFYKTFLHNLLSAYTFSFTFILQIHTLCDLLIGKLAFVFVSTSIVHFHMLFCFFRIMLNFFTLYSRPNSKFTRSSALSLIYLLEFLYCQEFPRFSHICIHTFFYVFAIGLYFGVTSFFSASRLFGATACFWNNDNLSCPTLRIFLRFIIFHYSNSQNNRTNAHSFTLWDDPYFQLTPIHNSNWSAPL